MVIEDGTKEEDVLAAFAQEQEKPLVSRAMVNEYDASALELRIEDESHKEEEDGGSDLPPPQDPLDSCSSGKANGLVE